MPLFLKTRSVTAPLSKSHYQHYTGLLRRFRSGSGLYNNSEIIFKRI